MTHDAPDRRSVIAGGIALAGSALLPTRRRGADRARPGRRSPRDDPEIPCRPRRRQAQGRDLRLERSAVAQLELFRHRRQHQARPAARADGRGAEGGRLGCAGGPAVARRHREDPQRDDAAGCAGVARQHAGPAFVGAVLVRGVRHARGNRRLGFQARRPSPASVDLGARQSHRLGHAVVVLGQSQPRHLRQACRPGHAARRGVAGRAALRRSQSEAAGQGADLGDADEQHHVLCRARARQCARRSVSRPPSWLRRSAT